MSFLEARFELNLWLPAKDGAEPSELIRVRALRRTTRRSSLPRGRIQPVETLPPLVERGNATKKEGQRNWRELSSIRRIAEWKVAKM